jgi:RNase H-like domain found in reverse transcriptase/Integrase zinc binding domain
LLGFFCYFKRFIRGFSTITSSLRELLQRDVPFLWEQKHDAALQTLKQALLDNVLLIYPNMNEKFYVVTNASKSACGHVLLQEQQGVLKPLIFGGRAYRKFERNLCATDLELLSVLDALKSYHPFLANGKKFTVCTDHISPKFIQNLKYAASPKLVRYALLMQHFNFDVEYIKGAHNVPADFFSRYPMHEQSAEDANDAMLGQYLHDIDHFNYLSSIQVEALAQDTGNQSRDPTKKRRGNYRMYELVPILPATQSSRKEETELNHVMTPITRQQHRTGEDNSTGVQSPQVSLPEVTDPHEALFTEHATRLFDEVSHQTNPRINLESQSDEPFIAAIIQYLKTADLPGDKEWARRVILQSEVFVIIDDQLFHISKRHTKKRAHLFAEAYQQLVIPRSLRIPIMTHLHEFSHFGYMKTYQTAIKKVWWPNISGDFADFCSSCLVCQQIKRSPQEKYPLQSIAVANPLQCLMIDYHEVRQNPKVRGSPFKYILILSDQMTQYVKLIATKDMTAQTTARTIMDEWILPFGCFRYLISDRGS